MFDNKKKLILISGFIIHYLILKFDSCFIVDFIGLSKFYLKKK